MTKMSIYFTVLPSTVLVASYLYFLPYTQAAEIPFGVTPKEISLSGTFDITDSGSFGFSRGKLLPSYEYKEGNRVGVTLDSISYTLDFWNVGELGGTSGYLFWKKDFGRATLRLDYVPDANGSIVGERVDNSKFGLPDGWKMEEAATEPDIDPESCQLRFSGGPQGTFKGSCTNGGSVEGRIAGTGTYVIFEKVTPPDTQVAHGIAFMTLANQQLMLNGQFSDWKFDQSTLEDSGARFSSLTGEVEARHEHDTEWQFAKLDTPLYVLDHVKTGEESQAIIGFRDLSTFLLKAESEIVITTPPKKDSKLKLVAGTIKANVKKLIEDGTMEVEMSQAVAGIKGTRFMITDTGTESKIEVSEGAVEFRSKTDGTTVVVGAGEAVTATAAGFGEKTTFDPTMLDRDILSATDVDPTTTGTAKDSASTGGTGAQTDDASPLTYLIWVAILATVAAGAWVVRKRRAPQTH